MIMVKEIYDFYINGFKSMKLGKKLWAIIAVKFFIFFIILKIFFFPDILKTRFSNDSQRGQYILNQLTQSKTLK